MSCTVLRFATAGSVDDGKSTLIGRLLYDSQNIYQDQLETLKRRSERQERGSLNLSLLTDGLKAEHEQGITIDVAYRYFSTPHRHFILADTPGHEQYTCNMATGNSTADLTIILIDARKGILPQTKRHALIASLLRVPRLLIAINKMDLVAYEEARFRKIERELRAFLAPLNFKEVYFLPLSALTGDNVVQKSLRLEWYKGMTLLEFLEKVPSQGSLNEADLRFPVQYVIHHANFRGYAGRIASGSLQVGDKVTTLPAKRENRIRSIEQYGSSTGGRSLIKAVAGESVVITLENPVDLSRGGFIVHTNQEPHVDTLFEAQIIWMGKSPLVLGKKYLLQQTAHTAHVSIKRIHHQLDCETLDHMESSSLKLNELGVVSIEARSPIFVDSYQSNRSTGSFILVDAETCETIAAGMILDRKEALNIHPTEDKGKIRNLNNKYPVETYWFTGLSGSGKSTIARALEQDFMERGRPVYVLEGDDLRNGLNADLDFSLEGRRENLRRAAEVAKLFNQAGITTICTFISPMIEHRERARQIIGFEQFIEVYLSTSIEICERRDPHKLYQKARRGEISHFTGISAPYEPPPNPDVVIDAVKLTPEDAVELLKGIKGNTTHQGTRFFGYNKNYLYRT